MSGWNELDDWVSSDQVIIEVLAMAGPIEIDDFAIIRDAVSGISIVSIIDNISLYILY